jgi:hypothetical protein
MTLADGTDEIVLTVGREPRFSASYDEQPGQVRR